MYCRVRYSFDFDLKSAQARCAMQYKLAKLFNILIYIDLKVPNTCYNSYKETKDQYQKRISKVVKKFSLLYGRYL